MTGGEEKLLIDTVQKLLQRVANLESLIQELSGRLEQLERTKKTKTLKVDDFDLERK